MEVNSKINVMTKQDLTTFIAFIRYNLKIVFANIFQYFILAAVLAFIIIGGIVILNSDTAPTAATAYHLLLVPGILIVFYPAAFSIQIDLETRMLETIFGIPDYRYKVYLVRLILIFAIALALLLVLAAISRMVLAEFSMLQMLFQLLIPLIFLASIAFMLATVTRSGAGTGTLLVIIIIGFWMAYPSLSGSKWNLFHNPFATPEESLALVWGDITFYNRVYLGVGAVLAILYGLLNLQKREKFI